MNPLHENPHHRTLRLAAALALGLFCGGRAFALDPARDLLQYNCQSWTRQNGLPVNGIKTITQSKDGFLWLGTAVGLLRFDGANFKLIDLTRVPGIRGSIVTSVANANDGGLWVGLQDGSFGYFDGRSLSLRGKPEWGGLSLDVRSVMEAKDGTLWLATHLEAARITRAGSYEPVMTATPERPADILFHFADSHEHQ
jgi:ligand-binding sensor domain-containing protein